MRYGGAMLGTTAVLVALTMGCERRAGPRASSRPRNAAQPSRPVEAGLTPSEASPVTPRGTHRPPPAYTLLGRCTYDASALDFAPGPETIYIGGMTGQLLDERDRRSPVRLLWWAELLDPTTCQIRGRWTYEAPMALLYLGQDGVCIAEAGALSLVDGQGRLRWKKATTRIRPQPHTALMAPEGLVVYSNSEIVCLDPKSGQMRWGRGVRASDQRSLSRQGGALYAIAPPVVSRLDWATGRDVWAADLPPLLQGYDGAEVHAAPGGVFFLTHDGWLGRLDGASGEMVCPWPHAGTTYSGLVATAAYAAASAPDGTAVTAWDPRTGAELWTSRPSGEESIAWSLVGGGGRALYVGSHPGVAALSAKDGQVLWRVKPQGPPAPPPDAYHGWYPTATAVEGDGVTFTLMGMDVVAVGERGKPMVRVNTPGPIFAHWLVGRRFYFVATASIGATTEEPSMYVIGPQGQAR